MSEMILQMAKAHLHNVAAERDRLIAEKAALEKKIEEIEEFLKKGIQEVREMTKVEQEKPNGVRDEQAAALAAERDLDRMPPTSMPFYPVGHPNHDVSQRG